MKPTIRFDVKQTRKKSLVVTFLWNLHPIIETFVLLKLMKQQILQLQINTFSATRSWLNTNDVILSKQGNILSKLGQKHFYSVFKIFEIPVITSGGGHLDTGCQGLTMTFWKYVSNISNIFKHQTLPVTSFF